MWVEFPFPDAYLAAIAEEAVEIPVGTTQETAQEATQETTQERIVALLREDPTLTRKALAERIGITPDGVKYHLHKLREAGRVRHIGSTKKGQWEVLGEGSE